MNSAFILRPAALLCLVLALLPWHAATAEPSPTARPNILWLVSEDNSANYVGAYGDPLARTPVLDALAAKGVVFERTYAPAPVCAPSRASLITGRYAPSLGTQHMRSHVALPAGLRYFPSYLREAGYFTTNAEKTDYNADILPGTWDESAKTAHWRHRRPGQPFFSVFNFTASHESSLHKRRPLRTDPARVEVPPYLPDTPEVRADIAQYYDSVNDADRQIGLLLAQLKEDGLEDDTIVFYYADNGGVLPRSKRFLYENGTHVPLIVSLPPQFLHLAPWQTGSRQAELVNLLDLGPTVLSLAGISLPPGLQGRALAGPQRQPAPRYTYMFRDRMDERYDLSRAVVDERFRYIRNYRPELPAGQYLEYLWRSASMSFWDREHQAGKLSDVQAAFFRPRPAEELYDLRADPHNVHNLAADPQHREVLLRLRAANRDHLLATRDLGFLPEAVMLAWAGTESPTRLAENQARYPLQRILTLLDSLQISGGNTGDIAAPLRDDSIVMRYWAALGSARLPDAERLVAPLLRDTSSSVRIAAAATTLRQGDSPAAWAVLADVLQQDPSIEARMEAANVVANHPYVPESLRPALEAAIRFDQNSDAGHPRVRSLCTTVLRRATFK